ncbi:MAG: hypothetical protein ACTSWW_03870 [Promethearchaeota archaeon]
MGSKDKKFPKWGTDRYKLTGCTSFEFKDPEWLGLLPTSSNLSKQEYRNLRILLKKLGKVKCYNCKHLDSGQCLYSRQMIQEREIRYKKTKKKIRCYYCNWNIMLFQEFLLNYQDGIYVCPTCSQAKEVGTLKEKLEDNLKMELYSLLKGMLGSIFGVLPLLVFVLSEINEESPRYWAVIVCLFPIFGLIMFLLFTNTKRRMKKKRLNELG